MEQNRQSPRDHTNKSNARKEFQDEANNSTDDKEFSEDLSRVLDFLAINEQLIQFRRKRHLSIEREHTLMRKAMGFNIRTYFFGSQAEGTTTSGLMSDIDLLQHFETFRLFLESENPPLQPYDHQIVLMVITNVCAPQYCFLLLIEPSKQARRFQKIDPKKVPVDCVDFYRVMADCIKSNNNTTGVMIPHTIMFGTLNQYPDKIKKANAKRHGPAESIWHTDHVNACYCKSLPKQCNIVFERPRPGHWPSNKTLKKAKKYGVFIVPQGPPKSTNICTYDNFDYQWRISTNLTERLFMFSLNTVHLKAYILTKMIRKELFVP
ncbi:hypothetical protein DPMN_131322 [Dreissena polymorpha]|uniref:Uncharacterized protein n=1 Tax=Dreissena polymorpha TaxID=45954 RepID=A0A9D4JZ92_DREPO|nr:hypothetical protein DPMN_131322 [Dreissena polymorpha]